MGFWQMISSATMIGQKRGFRMFLKGLLKIAAMIMSIILLGLLLVWVYAEGISKYIIYVGVNLIPAYILLRILKIL